MDYNITWRKKDKGWQFIISYKDSTEKWRQKSKQGFKTQKEGKPIAEKMLKELKKSIKTVDKRFNKITFKDFADIYLEHDKLYNQPKTIGSTITVINRFKDLNDKELCKITSLDIQRIVDNMAKESLNNNTIKYYLKKLKFIFKLAQEHNIITSIPTTNVKVGKSQEIIKKALTDDEIKDLLNKFKNNKYYLVIFLAVNTGMRIGEILGLTWDDINFADEEITVNKQWKKLIDGSWGFGDVKSKNSTRTIPISHTVCKELLKYKTVINMDNRIFNFVNKHVVIAAVSKKMKEFGYDITIHELRHTYATKLIANGLDFKTAAKILGHDVQQTLKTYSHVNNDMIEKAHALIKNIF